MLDNYASRQYASNMVEKEISPRPRLEKFAKSKAGTYTTRIIVGFSLIEASFLGRSMKIETDSVKVTNPPSLSLSIALLGAEFTGFGFLTRLRNRP